MDITKLIQENPSINITINAQDLLDFSTSLASKTVQEFINTKNEKLLTRTEVVEKFQVSEATLWRWTKHKIIHSKRVGGRVYYPESEIERLTALKSK